MLTLQINQLFESSVKEKDHQTVVDAIHVVQEFESSVKEKDHQTLTTSS